MARKPRIHFRGAVYHVLLRALEGRPVFRGVGDRRTLEALAAEGIERFDHSIHAFCFMPDHVQLAVEVGDAPLSRVMQNLSFRYTRHYNSQHGEDGPLFHGRYKAIVIDPDAYLLDLVRWIHNNPVRAGKVARAADFRWSSHGTYLAAGGREGAGEPRDWVTTERVLGEFGKTPRAAAAAFERFVDAGRAEIAREDLMRGTDGGRLLGDARFRRRALRPPKVVAPPMSLPRLVRLVCREEGVKESALRDESRARRESAIRQTIAWLALEFDIASLTALAERFNRDLTTMSRNQRYFRDRLVDDPALARRVRRLKRLVAGG